MLQLLKNRYFIFFAILYFACIALLNLQFGLSLPDLVIVLSVFGLAFPCIAWQLVKTFPPAINYRPAFKNEWIIIAGLIIFFVWYVTYGSDLINKLLPHNITGAAWKNSLAVLIKKLLLFVCIPFIVYKVAGFSVSDFGFSGKEKLLFSKYTVLLFVILSIPIILYQYFLSGGARPVRDGAFSFQQLLIGLPLLFAWLIIEVGLIEEFFFRALLQSRITALMKSPVAGIIISGLIFGLAHAPGLFLRGAESEGINEQLPFIFWAAYTISAMSLAGIFLGIIWYRTRNIYLIMALHAMVDLLPNFDDFMKTW